MKRALKQSIIVIGEGITEKYYFQHLKRLANYKITVRPRFFHKTNSISHYIKKVVEVICVFNADGWKRNQKEKEYLNILYSEYGQSKNVIICDTLPAIEYSFLIHFVHTNRRFNNYKDLRNTLRRYLES